MNKKHNGMNMDINSDISDSQSDSDAEDNQLVEVCMDLTSDADIEDSNSEDCENEAFHRELFCCFYYFLLFYHISLYFGGVLFVLQIIF